MRTSARHIVAAVALVLLAGCAGSAAVAPAGQVDTDGVVRYVALEGGFFSLESGRGKYDPINLPAAYHQDGLRVHFAGVVRTEMASIHMYAPILELTDIRRR